MQEKNENNKQSQDGWYEHKPTGTFVQLIDDPAFGVPLTNAYIKAGYTFVGKEDPRPKVVAEEVTESKKVTKKEA